MLDTFGFIILPFPLVHKQKIQGVFLERLFLKFFEHYQNTSFQMSK